MGQDGTLQLGAELTPLDDGFPFGLQVEGVIHTQFGNIPIQGYPAVAVVNRFVLDDRGRCQFPIAIVIVGHDAFARAQIRIVPGNVHMPNSDPARRGHLCDPVARYLDMDGIVHRGLDVAILNHRLRFIAFDVHPIAAAGHKPTVASPDLKASYHEIVAAACVHGHSGGRIGMDVVQHDVV